MTKVQIAKFLYNTPISKTKTAQVAMLQMQMRASDAEHAAERAIHDQSASIVAMEHNRGVARRQLAEQEEQHQIQVRNCLLLE